VRTVGNNVINDFHRVVFSRSVEIERTEEKKIRGSCPLYLDKEITKHCCQTF
jgi:hypothetical protein